MNFMLCLSLLAPLKTAIEIKEPFPTPEQIWFVGAAILGLWIFAVGASVGSFINVVVYRLPLGLSLSSPGSRCPRCLHPIRLQHNVPILGWLMLRGRCADCQLPISMRYPLVEFLVGSLFLLVGGVELIGNGVNLPRPSPEFARTVLNLHDPKPLVAASILHLMLLATLFCAANIEGDLREVPRRIVVPVGLLAIIVSVLWPDVHPIIALNLLDHATLKTHWLLLSPWLDLLAGGFAGSIAGLICRFTIARHSWYSVRFGGPLLGMWTAIGMVFGWQMVPFVLVIWAGAQFIEARRMRRPVNPRPVLDLLLFVLITLLFWRVFDFPRLINATVIGQSLTLAITAVVAAALLEATFRLSPVVHFLPLPVRDEEFLPTPEPAPEPATQTSGEPAAVESPLSPNESSEHE